MNTSWILSNRAARCSAAVGTVLFLSACGEVSPVDPRSVTPSRARSTASQDQQNGRGADIGSCYKLRAPEGSTLALHAYATGAQIYRWSGSTWTFVAPDAELFADAGLHGKIGTHYAGPTWESNSGSAVVGVAQERCTVDAASIPWLLLGAKSANGPGIFHRVIAIQRLNTVGGNAPIAAGSFVGEIERVPYTAEYFFYRN